MDRGGVGRILPWLPAVGWMAVIFVASSLPGDAIPGGYSSWGHLGEYAVLGVLLYVPWRRRSPWPRAALLSVVAASAYGITDELHQILTPGRMPDPADWATDTLGAALAVALAVVVLRLRDERRRVEV